MFVRSCPVEEQLQAVESERDAARQLIEQRDNALKSAQHDYSELCSARRTRCTGFPWLCCTDASREVRRPESGPPRALRRRPPRATGSVTRAGSVTLGSPRSSTLISACGSRCAVPSASASDRGCRRRCRRGGGTSSGHSTPSKTSSRVTRHLAQEACTTRTQSSQD